MIHLLQADLRSPIIVDPDVGLSIDSLLSAAVFAECGLVAQEAANTLGIKYIEVAGHTIPAASACFFDRFAHADRTTIPRRRRPSEMGKDFYDPEGRILKSGALGKLNNSPYFIEQGKGDFNALLNEYPAISADSIAWLIDTDKPMRVRELLTSLTFIGKRRGQGYGQIDNVQCKPIPQLSSAIISIGGRPLRSIPYDAWVAMGGDGSQFAALTAAYSISAWEAPKLECVIPRVMDFCLDDILPNEDDDGFVG